VQFAERGDTPSVDQALQVLESAPGPSQREILADLRAQPANLGDADQRLQALFSALQARVDTPDPARAGEQLNRVLSMPRYAGLSSGQSLPDRIVDAVAQALGRFLSWLGLGRLHLHIPVWIWLGLAAAIILGIIIWPIRSTLSRGGREATARSQPSMGRPRLDFFGEADRLAVSGDYLAAIRALAGGVAVRISGERAWDRSPYTVRELFQHSKDPQHLMDLLRTFEEASYGHRPPDQEMYARAAAAAEPFRRIAA
jgi:hypothetical protein